MVAALSGLVGYLTPENRARLEAAARLLNGSCGPVGRLLAAREAGMRRQSRLETVAVYVMAVFGLF